MKAGAPPRLFDLLDYGFEQTRRNFAPLLAAPLMVGWLWAALVSGVFLIAGWILEAVLQSASGLASLSAGAVLAGVFAVIGFGQIGAATWSAVVVGRLCVRRADVPHRSVRMGFVEASAFGGRALRLSGWLFGLIMGVPTAAGLSTLSLVWFGYRAVGLSWLGLVLAGVLVGAASLAGTLVLTVRFSLAPYALAVEGGSSRVALARSAALAPGLRGLLLGLILIGGALAALAYVIGFSVVGVSAFERASIAELRPMIPTLVGMQILGTVAAEVPLAVVRVFTSVCGMRLYQAAAGDAVP